MTERDFNALIDSVRELATATEDAAFDLATSLAPTDTAQLITTVARLNRMMDRIERSETGDDLRLSQLTPPTSGYRH